MTEKLVFLNGKWTVCKSMEDDDARTIKDIFHYYANVIGYARILMGVAAVWLIPSHSHLVIGSLLLASTVLDWFDGKAARYFNQVSVFGGGLDWFADVMVQIGIMMWWMALDISSCQLQFLFTCIELGNALLDFGIANQGQYAKLPKQYFLLNYWAPNGTWTSFADTCWISYHIWAIAYCISLGYPDLTGIATQVLYALKWGFGIPAMLFVFFEVLTLGYLLDCWRELKTYQL